MYRQAWGDKFPDVFVHAPWAKPTGLHGHPMLSDAKDKRDLDAADQIVREFVNMDYLDDIFGLCYEKEPLIVAPVSDPDASKNALAATFAGFLATELEFELESEILQAGSTGRDATRDNWYRLTHEASFSGSVKTGRNYIIADDVFTLGGTLASLRGFILNQGANVICMTSLAGTPMGKNRISLAGGTLLRLNKALNGELPKLVRQELGYEVDCLTEREAQYLLGCETEEEFRAGIASGRGRKALD